MLATFFFAVEATCLAKEHSGIGRYTFELVSVLENMGQNINLYTLEQAVKFSEISNLRAKKIYLNNTFRKILWVLFDYANFLKIDWFFLSKPDFLIFPNFKHLRSSKPSLTIIHDISYTRGKIGPQEGSTIESIDGVGRAPLLIQKLRPFLAPLLKRFQPTTVLLCTRY